MPVLVLVLVLVLVCTLVLVLTLVLVFVLTLMPQVYQSHPSEMPVLQDWSCSPLQVTVTTTRGNSLETSLTSLALVL